MDYPYQGRAEGKEGSIGEEGKGFGGGTAGIPGARESQIGSREVKAGPGAFV